MNKQLKTPVIFICFNRPETTAKVFQKIREARPQELFVVADGPRNEKEKEKTEAVRELVSEVDWECKVYNRWSEVNLGCRENVSAGITWAFEHTDEAIILEDDCLPNNSFFGYCESLLEKYRNDMRIMCISGDNFQDGIRRSKYSYYYSAYPHCWGWATWKRAWNHFDKALELWKDKYHRNLVVAVCLTDKEAFQWSYRWDNVLNGKIDSWAYQWVLACWMNSGLTCLPESNLVSNIGIGNDATHTVLGGTNFHLETEKIENIIHPEHVIRNIDADRYTLLRHGGSQELSVCQKILNNIRKIFDK